MRLGTESVNTKKSARSPTSIEIGWIAGFLEGEGSFAKRGSGVTATQVQKEPIVRLLQMLGGRIYLRRRVDKPKAQKNRWLWTIGGARARGVMLTIYPLMSPKRQLQIRRSLCS
jgi:hypothetical protein